MHNQKPTRANVGDLGQKWTYVASGLHPAAITITRPDTRAILCIHSRERFAVREAQAPIDYQGPIHWIDDQTAKECERTVGHWPTSGCFLLWWLWQEGILPRCTIYGIDCYRTGYYHGRKFEICDVKAHDMDKERPVMDRLLKMAKSVRP